MTEKMLPIEADLTLLRSQMPTKRRQFRRFRCNLATMAKLQPVSTKETQITWAYNLSQGGVGLNAPHPLEIGQEVNISFRIADKDLNTFAAKVIFCRLEMDRSWRIGCAFQNPILPDTLEYLLS